MTVRDRAWWLDITAAHVAALPAVDPQADTAEIEVVDADAAIEPPQTTAPAPSPPRPWPVIWLATTLVVIAAVTAVVIINGDPYGPLANSASGATTSTPTTGSSPTTTVSTAGGPGPGSSPAQQQPTGSLAAICAELDAQAQVLESQRHQVQETYRHNNDTRGELRRQLDAQQQAIAAQTRALGC